MPVIRPFRILLAGMSLALASVAVPASGYAQGAAQGVTVGPSGLPLPRFVSLKSDRVNMRVGPGLNYNINWLYLKEGLPIEIVQEYDTWRRVRDADGAEGWINQALLSGKRTAVAAPWFKGKQTSVELRYSPNKDSSPVAEIEPGATGTILSCNGQWCEMDFKGYSGWIDQSLVWGAYPGETIKD